MFRNKIRVAKYKRVSTDEQKLKKNSIIAQDELLDQYIAERQDLVLVGDFSDEGVSGTKIKRTELQSLLEMVENKEVDLIIFTKLDRWFRSVSFYHEVQAVLERNNVAWKAILEEYDTLTADGRLKVTLMLAIAQNEAERTSERIKVVFDSKIRHKQAVTGSQPFGFTTTEGNGARMVIRDPKTEHILRDLIAEVRARQSIRGAMLVINDRYDLDLFYNNVRKLLRNPLLYGNYHGIDDYCEGYMTKEEFDELQFMTSRNIKKRETNRTYIFAGLLICPCCNRRMSGGVAYNKKPSGLKYEYKRYRCPSSRIEKECDYKRAHYEGKLEKKILDQVLPQFDNVLMSAIVDEKKKAPKIDKKAVQAEISRLNMMFQKGRISEDDYDRQYEELERKLYAPEPKKKDFSHIQKLLTGNFKSLYETFDDHEKQIFWRSIIDNIEIDGDDYIINFL